MNLLKHTWALFLLFRTIGYLRSKYSVRTETQDNPEIKASYAKISFWYFVLTSIPWIIMGIGMLLNGTNDPRQYFNPKSLNPFVLVFHFYLTSVLLTAVWWIYFSNGATYLSTLPGLITTNISSDSNATSSPRKIKFFFAICLAGGFAALIMMWVMDFSHANKFGIHFR